ncbi:MAG TPA: hypothetical protein VL171_18995 [Verrucomicrobiae bacterium]|nr:hypothetical protein [Verrucomicrobiae bacterium]
MDIEFSCKKCGQHLVIDEAGAGLSIQCPTCGVKLDVPKPALPSPTPNAMPRSRDLYNESRDLIYELRVEDAIRVLDQADEARARERGYPSGGTLNSCDPKLNTGSGLEVTIGISNSRRYDTTSAQSVIDVARWAVGRSIENLMPKEEQELLGAAVCIQLQNGGMDEVLAVTLGSNLSWPALDYWFCRFKEAKHWPSTWEVYPALSTEPVRKFYGKNLMQRTEPLLATIHGLSLKARRLLLDGWLGWTRLERAGCNNADYDKMIEELVSAGFAVRGNDLPIAERLCLLTISQVREIQKKYGVKGARSKELIVRNLLTSVAKGTLETELPSDSYVKLNVAYREIGRYWFEYARAKLLSQFLHDLMFHFDRLRQFQRYDQDDICRYKLKAFMMTQSPKCPFCLSAARRLEEMQEVTPEAIPPFHPGCTCGLQEELEE